MTTPPGGPAQPRREPYQPGDRPSAGPPPQGPYGPPPPRIPPQGGPGGPGSSPASFPDLATPPEHKSFLPTLLDANFNYLITPKLIKLFYVLGLVLITIQCLWILAIGLWILNWDSGWAWGLFMVLGTPFLCLFEVVLVRIFMEAVIVRFKATDHLRVIRDRGSARP